MMYLSWSAFYEGPSDSAYFDVLLPRLMEEMILAEGERNVTIPTTPVVSLRKYGREIDVVANEVCKLGAAVHLLFVHADTGGRALEAGIASRSDAFCQAFHEKCGWQKDRCVIITPRHESEAWALANSSIVAKALGWRGPVSDLNLPTTASEAERLLGPKQTLEKAAKLVRGRSYRPNNTQILTSIAQMQTLKAFSGSESFRQFKVKLRRSLVDLGCLPQPNP